MGRLEEQDFDEKRLARRQRRKRTQTIAFVVFAVTMVIVIACGAFGVYSVKKLIEEHKAEKAEAAQVEASEEQTVVIETPQDVSSEPEAMSESDILEDIVNSCIGELTLEEKVAGLFMVTPEQFTGVATVVKAGSSTQDALSRYAIGGLVYSAKNIKSQEQITEMLKSTSDMSKYPIFTAICEDGSSDGAITASVGGLELGDINNSDTAYSAGTNIAAAMFKYGFNMDIAPKLDISENGKYGTDVGIVSDVAVSFVGALKDSGMISCVSDFPLSDAGTKETKVSNEITKDELVAGPYSVYQRAITDGGVQAVMMSNISFPGVTGDDMPASLSAVMIRDELRAGLSFDGVVVTGPLNQGAITESYTSAEAAVNAIVAGADVLYLPENFEEAYQGVLEAVQSGKITEDRLDESIRRIYRLKYADKVEEIN